MGIDMNKPALIIAFALASAPAVSSRSRAEEPRPSVPLVVMPTRRIPPPAVQTAIQNLREACLAWTPTITSGVEDDGRPLLISELESSDMCQAATEMTSMQTKMAAVGGVIALVVLLLASGVLGLATGIFRRVRYTVSLQQW
jgi:hypothetical protein